MVNGEKLFNGLASAIFSLHTGFMSSKDMKLGIFDSGLGGLLIADAVRRRIPDIDMVYLGDTLHVPYGKRSPKAVYDFTKRCVDFLFREQNCNLVVIACNTASASALRQLQQIYLPKTFPDRRILGVIVPTLECAVEMGLKHIGILGTSNIITGGVYDYELRKIDPAIEIHQQAAPLLVPLIEDGGIKYAEDILNDYISPMKNKGVDSIILGCTHYPYLKRIISGIAGEDIKILSQDELIPQKLEDYLERHPEISAPIGRNGKSVFYVTDITQNYRDTAQDMTGHAIDFEVVTLPNAIGEDDYVPNLERASG